MKLYQIADDKEVYGDKAGWWLVVSDDGEDELAGPFETIEAAAQVLGSLALSSQLSRTGEI